MFLKIISSIMKASESWLFWAYGFGEQLTLSAMAKQPGDNFQGTLDNELFLVFSSHLVLFKETLKHLFWSCVSA